MDHFPPSDPVKILVDPNYPMHIETPLVFSPVMSSRLGYDIYLKLEVLQPSQSFKYRGISLFAARAVKEHGADTHLVIPSGGNAGLALAWAGRALGVRTTVYIPEAAHEVKPALLAAGAEVIIGGKDYAEAQYNAEKYCSENKHAVLVHPYDHPIVWEGHSTLVHEIDRQLPSSTEPDAILCSVGGGGLLSGILRGTSDVGWDTTRVIALETFGANCYHLSILANSKDPTIRSLIPDDVAISAHPAALPAVQASEVRIARLPDITSQAASLGARSPAQAPVEMGLARRARADGNPTRFGSLVPVSVPDEVAMRSTLGFLDEQKMLVELACAATLAPAYIPGFLEALVPKSGGAKRPVVVFVVCGGSKITLNDAEKYRAVLQKSGGEGLDTARQQILVDAKLGLGP